MAKRGTQQDDEPDCSMVVDLEKYSIPDGTRYVDGLNLYVKFSRERNRRK